MDAAGQRLGLRLFLEGLEVPVISAQVQISINAPATAAIQVVPSDKITELKARTMVHLFFWDYTKDNEPIPVPPDPERVASDRGTTVDEAKQFIAENPDIFAIEFQNELRGYKLLFTGEIIGIVNMKTPAGRQAVLQCSDFSTYWDTTYQFFISYSPNGNFLGTSAAIWAGSDSMFDDLTAGHVSVMNEYLRSTPQTPGLTGVKGLMGGIISLLEAMGGVPNHTHGINDFFTIAELKNHILQQIVAEQNDDTAQRLFDDKAFMDWLTRGMSSLGELATFRDMMKLLFQYVYYEVVPNPAAMYVRSSKSQSKTQRVTTTTKVEIPIDLIEKIVDNRQATERWSVALYTDQPFDEDRYAKTFKSNFQKIINAPNMPKVYGNKLSQVLAWLDKIKSTVNDNRQTVTTAQGIKIDPKPSQTFKDNRAAWKKVTEICYDVTGTNERVTSSKNRVVQVKPAEVDRLNTQVFRPDCFFAAPPKCNVLFPDQYTQFSYSRNFLQETTRLRLSVDWLFGEDSGGLLAEYHFAPSTEDIQKIAKKQGNAGIRALLPWEIYSGILPKFETIHEMNYVAGQGERRRGIKGNIVGASTNYAQRTANFNYIKYRFAARSCEISAKFNPFLVCGFPAAIIDRPFIVEPDQALQVRQQVETTNPNQKFDDMSEFVKTAAKTLGAPTQYLGMVAALSHSVQQDGAATSLVLTHARTHRITDDDFLNIFSEEIAKEVQKSTISTALNTEDLLKKGDFRNLKFVIDATPQDLDKQAQSDADAAADPIDTTTNTDNTVSIENRPTGAPSLDSVASLTQFGTLLTPTPTDKPVKLQVQSSREAGSDSNIPIRGHVKKDRLQGTRQTILVPDPGGKLRVGATGPKGGKIVQIQCVSDAAIGIISQSASKKLNTSKPITLTSDVVDEFERDGQTGKLKLKTNAVSTAQVTYAWKQIVIYEEVTVTQQVEKLLPVEEGIRPPWFSPLYSNWFIGDEIYTPFFGCGSVVDQSLFVSDQGAATFGTGRAQQQDVLDKLKAAGNDRKQVIQILQDAKAKSITDVPDIESSVDVLAYIYGEVRRLNLDVHRFVHDYTRRPIATMEDILGSEDLEYQVNGDKLTIVSGTPGFHSAAIADVGGQLRGLVDNPDLALSRLKNGGGAKSPLSRDLDPRPGRRTKVLEYLRDINAGSGSLGIGVQG